MAIERYLRMIAGAFGGAFARDRAFGASVLVLLHRFCRHESVSVGILQVVSDDVVPEEARG